MALVFTSLNRCVLVSSRNRHSIHISFNYLSSIPFYDFVVWFGVFSHYFGGIIKAVLQTDFDVNKNTNIDQVDIVHFLL